MTISQRTTIQAYQLHKGGTHARMAILRMIAADSVNNRNESTRLQPGDWHGARHYTLGTYAAAYATLSQGKNGTDTVWYSHAGEEFRNERDADEVWRDASHWYTDGDGSEYATGIIASLTHGRFIAGYRWDSNGERVYFSQVFDDEIDAARMADEHARVFAENAREHSERFDEAQKLELDIEDSLARLRECVALRHIKCMTYVHNEARTLIESIRTNRESLRTDYQGVL